MSILDAITSPNFRHNDAEHEIEALVAHAILDPDDLSKAALKFISAKGFSDEFVEVLKAAQELKENQAKISEKIRQSGVNTFEKMDDLIYGVFEGRASQINNGGSEAQAELLGFPQGAYQDGDLDGNVHDHFSNLASEVNNSGQDEQIRVLLCEGYSVSEIVSALDLEEAMSMEM